MEHLPATITASGVLFGFLFAGFWWALNRELSFEKEQRHFKLSFALLLLGMAILAIFGIVRPLHILATTSPRLGPSFKGIVLALVSVFGYMLAELGHYSVFQRPKYITKAEGFIFCITIIVIIALAVCWIL